jgi:hypothetical protein
VISCNLVVVHQAHVRFCETRNVVRITIATNMKSMGMQVHRKFGVIDQDESVCLAWFHADKWDQSVCLAWFHADKWGGAPLHMVPLSGM